MSLVTEPILRVLYVDPSARDTQVTRMAHETLSRNVSSFESWCPGSPHAEPERTGL